MEPNSVVRGNCLGYHFGAAAPTRTYAVDNQCLRSSYTTQHQAVEDTPQGRR
jgi:hypothetical protein